MQNNKKSFRGLEMIDANDTCRIDFMLARKAFKDEYMRDAWAQRTLNFHLENMQAFKKFLDYEIGETDKIDSPMIERYVKYMRKRGLKVNTINGRIKTLRVFYSLLYDKGYINCNPTAGLKRIAGKDSEIIPFTDEQIRSLLNQPDQNTFIGMRDYMILNVFSDTGIRLDEFCNVKVSDIDLINSCISNIHGKGTIMRTVFFGIETRKAIIAYLKYTRLEKEDYLLLNQDGERLTHRTVQDRIKYYGEKAGIKGVRVSPHTFRHYFAKTFLMNNGDTFALQALLGHRDMRTVLTYIKLFTPDLAIKYEGRSPVDSIRNHSRRPDARGGWPFYAAH